MQLQRSPLRPRLLHALLPGRSGRELAWGSPAPTCGAPSWDWAAASDRRLGPAPARVLRRSLRTVRSLSRQTRSKARSPLLLAWLCLAPRNAAHISVNNRRMSAPGPRREQGEQHHNCLYPVGEPQEDLQVRVSARACGVPGQGEELRGARRC